MRKWLLVVVLVLLTGCFSTPIMTGQPLEQWDKFKGASFTPARGLDEKTAELVFIREADKVPGPAFNIYVNENYLASLLDGTYKSVVVCVDNHRVAFNFSSAEAFTNRYGGVAYPVQGNSVNYLKIVNGSDGIPTLKAIEESEALQLVSGMNKVQAHTLSRFNKRINCDLPPIVMSYVLNTSELFNPGRGDYENMLDKGKEEFFRVGKAIQSSDKKIDIVQISTYTDSSGSATYNQKLSERRAKTIRQVLREAGVDDGVEINVVGYGSQDLVADNCAVQHAQDAEQREACDQLNRRVEIVARGRSQ